jgi:hypothetical protein
MTTARTSAAGSRRNRSISGRFDRIMASVLEPNGGRFA